jgi:uncharacterized protein (DUF1330 family)
VFDEFEVVAIPIISKYNGKMLLRVRPADEDFIEASIEHPYEIHLTEFESEADLQKFMQDEERKKFLHLKEASIQAAILYKGERL